MSKYKGIPSVWKPQNGQADTEERKTTSTIWIDHHQAGIGSTEEHRESRDALDGHRTSVDTPDNG
jgi:hypothetical protein